jgi:glycosyltransferase involved in cell wall biosynthesis
MIKFFKILLFSFLIFSIKSWAKVTLSMIVKNEANHYLPMVLEEVRQYIDEAVIIDDASTDETIQVIYEKLKDIPLHIIHNPVSKFSNEVNLRKQQWQEAIKTNPDWILNIDADHVFELKMREEIKQLTNQNEVDVWCFRLYDLWDMDHYRDDYYWQAHNTYRPFLIRYRKDFTYTWKETPQHCGHFPKNIFELRSACTSIRLKHYGWASKEDRIAKYRRYQILDPGAVYGWKEQYESILDENPHLVKWEE